MLILCSIETYASLFVEVDGFVKNKRSSSTDIIQPENTDFDSILEIIIFLINSKLSLFVFNNKTTSPLTKFSTLLNWIAPSMSTKYEEPMVSSQVLPSSKVNWDKIANLFTLFLLVTSLVE